MLSIYSQYTVDTGLVAVINEIMQDQYFAPSLLPHAASAANKAILSLHLALLQFEITGSLSNEFMEEMNFNFVTN